MVKQGYKQTEIGVIPEDWEVKELGDVLITNPDYGINAAAVEYDDTLPTYLRITDIDDNGRFIKDNLSSVNDVNSSKYYLEEDEIVFARTGASVGKTYLYKKTDGKLVFAGFLIRAKINSSEANSKLIFYNTQTKYYQNWIISNSMRSGQPGINSNEIKSLQIPLPPLPEQEAIAEALSDADAWIASLEQLIAKKRLIKQGAMQELLTPPSTSSGNADGEALEPWEVKKLGEVATYRRGSFPQPYGLDKWYDDTNGMPFIQVFDVAKNRKLKPDTKRKISDLAQPMSVFVPKGTIVLTIQGSIGRIALTQYDAYCDRTLLIFEKIDSGLDKFYFLLTVEQIFEIEKEKAPGGTIKTITKEALSDFVIKYPKSLPEQTRIATILSDMDAELEALEQKLSKARQIKQGMMQELLTGRVRLL